MATYLLAWNPKDWDWTDLPQAVREVHQGAADVDQWSIGRYKKPGPGDRFFLIKLGVEPKGLIGSGHISSSYFEDTHYADPSKICNYVSITFDHLVDGNHSVVISRKELDGPGFQGQHWDTESSGISIKPSVSAHLETVWLSRLGITGGAFLGDELEGSHAFVEGGRMRVEVNRYERDPDARKACIDHYGTRCVVCDIDLVERYGPVAAGFIHVHHLLPLSTLKKSYKVDPIKDLRPVCPNCHSIIHRGGKSAYMIEAVRGFIASTRIKHK